MPDTLTPTMPSDLLRIADLDSSQLIELLNGAGHGAPPISSSEEVM